MFSPKHRLLARQLRRHFGDGMPTDPSIGAFLRSVDDAYSQADEDRDLLERSLSTVSEELLERYHTIKQSESKYRYLFDGNPLPMWVCDAETRRFVAVNEAAVREYRFSREEFLTMTILDVGADEGVGVTGGRVSRHRTKGGAIIDVEVTTHDLTFDGRPSFIMLATNVTERQRMETEREQALSLLRATFDATTDGILVIDNADRVQAWNTRFTEMWCLSESILQSGDVQFAVNYVASQMSDPIGFAQRIDEIMAQPDAESFDVLELKDGRVFERASMPQRVTGRVVGRVWSFRDATRRLQAEGEVRRIQKLDAMGRLAGGVAHDFNNLLAAILSNAEFALESSADGSAVREELDTIVEVAHRAAALTRQLLTFSRKQVLVVRDVSFNAVVADAERLLSRLLPKNITFRTTLDPKVRLVQVDGGHLEQILVNLVVNARDAMPNGGTLTVTTSRVEGSDVGDGRAAPARAGEYARLTVSDTGCGMSRDVQARIFEPFFTTKEVGQGTGLGLATVFGIVEQSGGHVDVESRVNIGTVFSVWLPHLSESTDGPAVPDAPARVPHGANGETVLLVEDEDSVRNALARTLKRHGYRVLVAHDGAEALEVFARTRGGVSLLVTDLVMPKLGGGELAARLRSTHPELPVLYTSGYAEVSLTAEELAGPHTQFIQKPFRLAELLEHVQTLLACREHAHDSV